MEMALTGDTIDAARAYQHGLVNILCGPGEAIEAAKGLAERINANAPLAVRATRKAVRDGALVSDEEGIRIAVELFGPVASSEDAKEGPLAFVEKRPLNGKHAKQQHWRLSFSDDLRRRITSNLDNHPTLIQKGAVYERLR